MTARVRVVVPADVELPALSTDIPPRSYNFIAAIREWACYARSMREEENLEHYEELVHVLDTADASKPEQLEFTKPCYLAAKAAFNEGLNAALDARTLPTQWVPKILKMYHAFTKSTDVKEN